MLINRDPLEEPGWLQYTNNTHAVLRHKWTRHFYRCLQTMASSTVVQRVGMLAAANVMLKCLSRRCRGQLPEWSAIAGTSFVVDCFVRSAAQTHCKHWFLTHFHADHYRGLSSKFQSGEDAKGWKEASVHSDCNSCANSRSAACLACLSLRPFGRLQKRECIGQDEGFGKSEEREKAMRPGCEMPTLD